MLRRTRAVARTMGRTAVIAGTATVVSGHVAARQQARHGQQTSAAEPPPAQPPPVDVADELTKLANLRDRGILTEAEFEAQKARVLAF